MVDNFKRIVAQKLSIRDIIGGSYIKEGGNQPNHVVLSDGRKISRVNIMAVVLSKSVEGGHSSVVLDDGTATISVRSFEKNKNIERLQIGDIILLIGRVREYGGRYIIPEIVKKIVDGGWIEVRKLEVGVSGKKSKKKKPVVEEKISRVGEEPVLENSSQTIYNLIRSLDDGNGVDVENVVKNSKLDDTEKIISNLLREGEVFELKPGVLKILE